MPSRVTADPGPPPGSTADALPDVVGSWAWWSGAWLLLLAGVFQVFAAGLLVFGAQPQIHPPFGYVLGLGVVVQALLAVASSRRRRLAGPALLALVAAVATIALALALGTLGPVWAAAHPVGGVVIVLAQYELVRRTTGP